MGEERELREFSSLIRRFALPLAMERTLRGPFGTPVPADMLPPEKSLNKTVASGPGALPGRMEDPPRNGLRAAVDCGLQLCV
jgi:hypothetical protein